MTYTTHGLMTAADMADMRDLYDLNPEPVTLADLARELGATPGEVATFGNLDDWRADSLVDALDADAIREAWCDTPCRRDQFNTCRDAGVAHVCH